MGANKNEDKKRFLKGKKMKVKKHIWANGRASQKTCPSLSLPYTNQYDGIDIRHLSSEFHFILIYVLRNQAKPPP